ncbi:MAG: four helix bundle protein [Acidobacteria bacterium]|nr:four helix bundle protein [Acidobacteriota bacterium]
MRGHRDLVAWQKAMDLTKKIYVLTNAFPKHEVYGLTSQLRRAAVSIPSSLAEGAARNGQREFSYFISTARGSLAEVETQVELAVFLNYIPQDAAKTVMVSISDLGRILIGLRNWSSGPQVSSDKQPETRNKKLV